LGASVAGLAALLSKDFLRLVAVAFLIALLTISSLAIKAALMNPVKTLRAE
jgi:hypothetical protein